MGPRMLSYNGKYTQSYDTRNNQLFIQSSNNRISMNKFLDKSYLMEQLTKDTIENNYIFDIEGLGKFTISLDSLKINEIKSVNKKNGIMLDNIIIGIIDTTLKENIYNIKNDNAIIFDMRNE